MQVDRDTNTNVKSFRLWGYISNMKPCYIMATFLSILNKGLWEKEYTMAIRSFRTERMRKHCRTEIKV